ncbi:glycerophosphodiester phosphodiesterase family protein [Alphaproteobacteria bacterium]|nr:glycerophosphodiester phosphodiesterase family protein [Alphaproteobacteria bacterium]
MQVDKTKIQAHRGASGLFPENTMLAFRQAHAAGALSIETDLSPLMDGAFAIFHDNHLGRTTGGPTREDTDDTFRDVSGTDITGTDITGTDITSLGSSDLLSLEVGSWKDAAFADERIPLLNEVLDWQAETGMFFNWEMKCHDADPAAAAAALARHLSGRDLARSMVSSFAPEFIEAAMIALPDLPRALISDAVPQGWRDIGTAMQLEAFHLNFQVITPDLVAAMHEAGFKVRVYTVNERDDMNAMLEAGIDTVITDYPERWISA